ncbi:MAG: glycosyltransferase family 4 protein, partial [Patescibacteria group bacterium]
FLSVIYTNGRQYEKVLVHMNPEYIVLGGLLWRLLGKRTGLWYTHKHTGIRLRIAVLLSHVVFTASRASFRLETKKLHVMGHGIDWPQFLRKTRAEGAPLHIVTVGRVSATKRIREMLQGLDVLAKRGTSFTFSIVGAPATQSDTVYQESLMQDVSNHTYPIEFRGPVRHAQLPELLSTADIFLNLSSTGSLDKAVLEALCAGVSVVSSNEAFEELLRPYGLQLDSVRPGDIADGIERALYTDSTALSARVRKEHSLSELIPAILRSL